MSGVIRAGAIRKARLDKLNYRGLTLANQLRCLLISDPETTISSASMDVSVGSIHDPREYQGMAHFLEHMLFLGSEKYPDESGYKSLVSQNGGSTNAYTALFSTNYYFQVKSSTLPQVMQIFPEFFISPLFSEDGVMREIKAVDSEATKNLSIDSRRLYHLRRHLANPDSEFNKYSTGNLQTLNKPGIRDAMKEFYHKHYSADLMSLVVYDNQPLDRMETSVIDLFSRIPNKSRGVDSFKRLGVPYSPERLGQLVRVIPLKKQDSLSVSFILPEAYSHRNKKPLSYLSQILGHECRGSLADSLTEAGLISSLSAGSSDNKDYFATFDISVSLTKKGLREYETVLAAIGKAIQKLRDSPIQPYIYQEMKEMAKVNFEFQTKASPVDTVLGLAASLTDTPFEEILTAGYNFDGLDGDYISSVLKLMVPENSLVFLVSDSISEMECPLVEPIYGTQFSNVPLTSQQVAALSARSQVDFELTFPSRNLFIPQLPTLLSLLPPKRMPPLTNPPRIVLQDHRGTMRHLQDDCFGEPRAILWFGIYDDWSSTVASANHNDPAQRVRQLERQAMLSLWSSLFEKTFRSTGYSLALAGASASASSTLSGLNISVKCYSPSLQASLEALMEHVTMMRSFNDPVKFHDELLRHKRSLDNRLLSQPYEQANELLGDALSGPAEGLSGMLEYYNKYLFDGDKVKPEAYPLFLEFTRAFLTGRVLLDGVLEGTSEAGDAIGCFDYVVASLNKGYQPKGFILPEERYQTKIKQLTPGQNFLLKTHPRLAAEANGAIVEYYQYGRASHRERAAIQVLSNFLKEKYFTDLRTKQQLGYIVHMGASGSHSIFGFKFYVQSHLKDPIYCEERTRAFLDQMRQEVRVISNQELNNLKTGIIANLEKPFESLEDQANFHIGEVYERTLDFGKHQQLIEEVRQVRSSEVFDIFEKVFYSDQKRIQVHAVPKHMVDVYKTTFESLLNDKQRGFVPVKSPAELRKKLPYFGQFGGQKL